MANKTFLERTKILLLLKPIQILIDNAYLLPDEEMLEESQAIVQRGTEMGILIDSPELGEELADRIEYLMQPENSWRVQLDEDGKLMWVSVVCCLWFVVKVGLDLIYISLVEEL